MSTPGSADNSLSTTSGNLHLASHHVGVPQDTFITFRGSDDQDSPYVTINMTKGTVDSNIAPDRQAAVIVEAMNRFVESATCSRCGSVIKGPAQ